MNLIRLGIQNLAGVPSVVFGLFGLGLFVIAFDLGISIVSGSLTLGLLILPIIIGASEEALKQVPDSFRQASLALGATRWQTIRKVVLPAALPGILTGSILAIGRAAGETAPIMFTAATFYTLRLPSSPFDEVMALPYHIYVLATAGTHIEQTRPLQYGTVLVLIALVLGLSLTAVLIRSRMREDPQMVRRRRRDHHPGGKPGFLLRLQQGPGRHQPGDSAQPSHGPHRAQRLRQIHLPAPAQPHERADTRHPGGGQGSFSRAPTSTAPR